MSVKNCVTCKHSDIYEYKEPCASCENYQKWESPAPQWISVEERKPKDQEIVLLGYAGNLTDCGYYDEEEAEWCNYESIKVESPTHWMPKPEPPKEG